MAPKAKHVVYGRVESSSSSTVKSSDASARGRKPIPQGVSFARGDTNTSSSSGNAEQRAEPPRQLAGEASDDESGNDSEEFEAGHPTAAEQEQQEELQRAAIAAGPRPPAGDISDLNVPLRPDGQPSSVGSAGHFTGKCKVCIFAHSKKGCMNGVMCSFCHMPHRRQKNKLRSCKGKRDRHKKLVKRLQDEIDRDPEGVNVSKLHLPPFVADNESLRTKLLTQMHAYAKAKRQDIRDASSASSARPAASPFPAASYSSGQRLANRCIVTL